MRLSQHTIRKRSSAILWETFGVQQITHCLVCFQRGGRDKVFRTNANMSATEKPKEKMDTGSGKKRVRQRKLSLYDNIRKQMEFYFSTPNLQKDRFLKKLVVSDPEGFVELEMFLNFNKIKALTTDLACIAKAIKESKTLTVDETGKKIKRKCKFEEPQDTDQRTVYAEFLPKDSTIDWLIKHFSQVGKVVHVSLPKYKSTGDIKGFAFVEFETVEAAAKACQLLNCPPEKVCGSKPGIFAKTFKTGRHMKKALQQDSDISEAMEVGGNAPEVKVECEDRIEEEKMEVEGTTSGQEAHVPKDKTKKKKRKRSESFSGQKESKTSEDVKPEAIDELVKPDATKDDDKLDASKEDVVDRNKSKKKRKRSESCETVQRTKVEKLEESEDVQESTTKKKKPKSAKVKEEVKDGEQNDAKKPEAAVKSSEPDHSGTENTPKKKPAKKKAKQGVERRKEGLRVISKQEWLEYRQDYYQRHKQNMSELKMKIREIKGKQATDDQPKTTLVSNGDLSEEVSNQPIKKEEGLTFIPGVIIKVTLAEPVSKKFLKEHMSGSGKVAFLDMTEGDSTAHARCEDVDSAATILKASTQECQYTLLQGEEEKTYWDKVFSDREKRLSTKTKKKVRGNDKILAKADKVLRSMKEKAVHIVFDD